MLYRIKNDSWQAHLESLTAKQLNRFAADLSRAVDGTNGGTYQPAVPLKFKGSPVIINTPPSPTEYGALLDTTQQGTATRGATGHFPRRITLNQLSNTSDPQLIDTTADIWWQDPTVVPSTMTWNVYLSVTGVIGLLGPGVPAPVDGDEIMYVQAIASAESVRFYNQSGGSVGIIPGNYTNQFFDTPLWVRFFFDATSAVWRIKSACNDFTT